MVHTLQQCRMSGAVVTSDDPRPDHKHEYSDLGQRRLNQEYRLEDKSGEYLDQEQEDSEEEADEVSLQPFRHQVGGHTRIMLLDPATLCKALQPREHNFYLHIPEEMQKFVPKYKGVIQVSPSDGAPLTLRYSPGESADGGDEATPPEFLADRRRGKTKPLRVRLHRPEDNLDCRSNSSRDACSDPEWSSNSKQCFLLLENVASQYQRPCILDLKMGTRQHGDNVPADKQTRHIAKCAASTSATLGVRFCGMQVYQADACRFEVKDKYYGRRLDEAGFKKALGLFFHNGFQPRTDVMAKVVKRLRALRRAVEKQNSFRFYSSSLLIIYDGWGDSECSCRHEDVHHVENLHSSPFCDDSDIHHRHTYGETGPYTHGSRNLQIHSEETMFLDSSEFYANSSSETGYCGNNSVSLNTSDICRVTATSSTSNSSMSVDSGMELSDDSLTDSEESNDSRGAFSSEHNKHYSYPKINFCTSDFRSFINPTDTWNNRKPDCGSSVDVRMIDFAHTTFRGHNGDSSAHRGPDTGYIQGLDSLIRLLIEIMDEA